MIYTTSREKFRLTASLFRRVIKRRPDSLVQYTFHTDASEYGAGKEIVAIKLFICSKIWFVDNLHHDFLGDSPDGNTMCTSTTSNMYEMPVRRSSDPVPLQHVWDAIRSANSQKQMADITRIIRYLQRFGYTSAQAELHLKQSIEDNLVMILNKITVKGAKTGSQVESYKIPHHDLQVAFEDDKDWYCIDCHLGGDVIECRVCYHVYHLECGNQKMHTFKKTNNYGYSRNIFSPKMSTSTGNTMRSPESNIVIDITDENNSPVNNNIISNIDINKKDFNTVECINQLLKENCQEYDITLCSICNMFKLEPKVILEKEELNCLLSFVYSRIRTWLPADITQTLSSDERLPEWMTTAEISWRSKILFYKIMNMTVVGHKVKMNEYSYLVQFKADILTMQHNVAIYHGVESQEYGAAKYMLSDCDHDLQEIVNCPDCYKYSNEKISDRWFCLPCRVPHRLVWAKQKGYPYWPAKVMKIIGDEIDVRFFGGKYERSILSKMYVKPIIIKMKDAQVKKNGALNKAVAELSIHQKMLENPSEVEMYLTLNRKQKIKRTRTSISVDNMLSKKEAEKNDSLDDDDLNVQNVDDLFIKSVEGLEATLSAQSASLYRRKKRSVSPTSKMKISKAKRRTSIGNHEVQMLTSKNESVEIPNKRDSISNSEEISFRDNVLSYTIMENHEEVTSSTEQLRSLDEQNTTDNSDRLTMPNPDRQYSESVEKTRRKLEQCNNTKQLIQVALESMQAEIDNITTLHDEHIKKLFESHNAQISDTKRKQWSLVDLRQWQIHHALRGRNVTDTEILEETTGRDCNLHRSLGPYAPPRERRSLRFYISVYSKNNDLSINVI
ncbi:hypothetical protein FQA39_LY15763 [Lamprigera yunnana]|nr:hypothetical protein FQA39_LY15763 [Lamprigera yunnana]